MASCVTSLSGLVEKALFSSPAACFSSAGVSDCMHSCPSYSLALTSRLQSLHRTKTSDSSRSVTLDAGLMCDGTRGQSSEQDGQFTLPDAAINSTRHLVHTSALHINSSGRDRMLVHSAHFSSSKMEGLFTVDKGGKGSCRRTGGGAIVQRWAMRLLGVIPA